MANELTEHPVAELFPELSREDFAALVEDIRLHGVKMPILVHKGQILDGRHRYKACRQLGKRCPSIEWDGRDPWLEAQSRNLLRRHLGKEQIYAIRLLAAARFPEFAAPIATARQKARQRKAQAKGRARGVKALSRASDRQREAADEIGAQLGVSGGTVKRVDRVARLIPELLPQVAAGVLSAHKAVRSLPAARGPKHSVRSGHQSDNRVFIVNAASHRLRDVIRREWSEWPPEHRTGFLRVLQLALDELVYAYTTKPVRLAEATPMGCAV